MRILLNAMQARVAGGRSVAQNFLRAYRKQAFEHELVAFVPEGAGYEELGGDRVEIRPVPSSFHRIWWRSWVDRVWWPRTLKGERADVLFNVNSIAIPVGIPQLVIFHWSYAIYPEPEVWRGMDLRSSVSRRLRRWVFRRRLRYATAVAAQTDVARRRLEDLLGARNVHVVPNAVPLPSEADAVGPELSLPDGGSERDASRKRLLCLSRYYPHKNLEVLLPLARAIRDRGLPYEILTTFEAGDHPRAEALLRSVEREGLSQVWCNLGSVPMERVPALYRASDALLLPTLLESFSGTYVEAMHYGIPILTSDRDFAHDVCGDGAFYFDPRSPSDILRAARDAFGDAAALERAIATGRERAHALPDWPEVAARYVRLLEGLAQDASR